MMRRSVKRGKAKKGEENDVNELKIITWQRMAVGIVIEKKMRSVCI